MCTSGCVLPFDIYTHCINLHNRRCLEHTAAVHAPLGLRFRVHVALPVYIIVRMRIRCEVVYFTLYAPTLVIITQY